MTRQLDDIKEIEGFPGYSVTNGGMILSDRGNMGRKRRVAFVGKDGYERVILMKDGKPVTRYVHRLVAEAFVPREEGKPDVRHKNGDKRDNWASNLEWVTHKENLAKSRVSDGGKQSGGWNKRAVECREVWGDGAGGGVRGEWVRWESVRAWALASGNANRAANVCAALRDGRVAYGAEWRYADAGGALKRGVRAGVVE